jgi:hypothetical protein
LGRQLRTLTASRAARNWSSLAIAEIVSLVQLMRREFSGLLESILAELKRLK